MTFFSVRWCFVCLFFKSCGKTLSLIIPKMLLRYRQKHFYNKWKQAKHQASSSRAETRMATLCSTFTWLSKSTDNSPANLSEFCMLCFFPAWIPATSFLWKCWYFPRFCLWAWKQWNNYLLSNREVGGYYNSCFKFHNSNNPDNNTMNVHSLHKTISKKVLKWTFFFFLKRNKINIL